VALSMTRQSTQAGKSALVYLDYRLSSARV